MATTLEETGASQDVSHPLSLSSTSVKRNPTLVLMTLGSLHHQTKFYIEHKGSD